MKRIVLFILLAIGQTASAQTDSIHAPQQRERAAWVALGHASVLDTYLGQEHFNGTEIRYLSETLRSKKGRQWTAVTSQDLSLALSGTRGNDRSLMSFLYQFAADATGPSRSTPTGCG